MAKTIDLTTPITKLVADVKRGDVTATMLTQASLARIAETEAYHAVLEVS